MMRRNELSSRGKTAAPTTKINASGERGKHPESGVAAIRPQREDAHRNCP